jgi:hypothetical protein
LVGKAHAEYAHKKAKADATGMPRREYARVGRHWYGCFGVFPWSSKQKKWRMIEKPRILSKPAFRTKHHESAGIKDAKRKGIRHNFSLC